MESSMAEKKLEFILHVIPPPMRLNWSSPRSLFISTLLNHLRGDKAPIGHLYVEFTLPHDSIPGGSRVITGMSRQKMTPIDSIKLVQGKRLGLGSFYYDFNGKLDSTEEAREEIIWAKNKKRHATIHVSISENTAQLMLAFLKQWIEQGSFRHYSGGLRVDIGEGAGCAEFGMHFLSMALGVHAINPDWVRKVRIPHHLIGGGFAGHSERISILDIFTQGGTWAKGSDPHHVYSIPDPELIFDWIKDHSIANKNPSEFTTSLIQGANTWSTGEFVPQNFKVNYARESSPSIEEQWMRVVEKIEVNPKS